MKYKLLKLLDTAGLQVLDPIVRLCAGEDPPAQLRKIGLFIGIPLLTFLVFLWFWNYAGPRHTTKSGEVPTPAVVKQAAAGVLTFHQRETLKQRDYVRAGEDRTRALAEVESALADLEPRAAAAAARLREVEDTARGHLTAVLAPLNEQFRARRLAVRDAAQARQTALADLAAALARGAPQVTAADLIAAIEADRAASAAEQAEIARLRDVRADAENRAYPPLLAARQENNALGAELQFLRQRQDILARDNRALRTAEARAQLTALEQELATAADPAAALAKATAVVQARESLATLEQSTYTRPWTLPAQIGRSLRCVFTGFFIATLVAVPLGILCGLSRVFMAAMTPLISLFKPVSPIVWLPIIFIIVGGFVPDPSNSGLLRFLNSLPGLRGMDINPAFLASALTVAVCSLWPTLVNTALGVTSIDKDHLNVARVLRLGPVARLFKIVLPSALPLMFAGLRISLGVGWMVLIAAELLSSSEGIGKFVWDMFNNGSSQTFAQMFVVVFVVGAIGLFLDRIMIVLQRLVSFDDSPTAI